MRLIILLSAFLAATPSVAADAVDADRFGPAPNWEWTGFYAGIGIGYHAGDVDFSDCVGLCPTNPKLEGLGAGVQAGYDYQLPNNVVLGAFAAVPLVGPSDSFDIGFGIVFDYEAKFAAVLGGRVGYAFGRTLPYVTAGYHIAEVEAKSGGMSVSRTHHGYQIGVGVEYMLTDHFSTDLRYSYSDTGKESYDFGGGASRWGETASTVSMALNWRF